MSSNRRWPLEPGNEGADGNPNRGGELSESELLEQLTRLAQARSVASLSNRDDLLRFAPGAAAAAAAAPSLAPSDAAAVQHMSAAQLMGLQQRGRGAANAADPALNLGDLYSSLASQPAPSPQYRTDHLLRGALQNFGLPTANPPTHHLDQADYLGLGSAGIPTDTLSLLRQELAASSSAAAPNYANYYPNDPVARLAPPPNAASAYLDFLAQRQPARSAAPSLHHQFTSHPSLAPSPSTVEAFLASRSLGGAALPDHGDMPYSQLRQYQDRLAGIGLPGSTFNQYQPLLPDADYVQRLERAESTRFLAEQGIGAPNEVTFLGSHMSRNHPTYMSAARQELKDDFKDASVAAGRESKEDDPYQLDVPWNDLVSGSTLSLPEHRGMVSDVHLAVFAQMKPCTLTHEDRVGLYKTREIGFPGICCKHCGGVPGFGRYFPGSLTSLVNGNIVTSIIKHINEECRVCPNNVRESLLKLERHDALNPFHCRRGSRRQFFTDVWNKIQEGGDQLGETSMSSREEGAVVEHRQDDQNANIPWDKILEGSEVVQLSDRHLVPDTIFAATAQTKPCQVTEGDRVGRCKDHKLGSMGLCCKHCGGKEGAFGRYFPSNLHTFAQVEVCKQIVRHITRKCHACPNEIRDAILKLQQLEKTQASKRYPSRMVFFRRVWYRFHYHANPEGMAAGGDSDEERGPGEDMIAAEDIPWQRLVKDSKLVTLADQGLISDSQYAALAQMDKCKLTEEDRIGYNKDRDVGFVGMCCRFCGGRPGFGRYFPNTVRNFEKTSARETLVSHISLFCRKCPEDVRNAILSLKRIESSRDGSATMKALIYGSGKLFFRRVWSRLHSEGEVEDSKPPAVVASDQVGGVEGNLEGDDAEESVDSQRSEGSKSEGRKRPHDEGVQPDSAGKRRKG